MKFIDNVLPENLEDDILNYMSGPNFPWYFIPDVTREDFKPGDYAQPGFHHTAFHEYTPKSPLYDYFKFLSFFIENNINYKSKLHLFRIRAGLNIPLVNENTKFDQEYNFPHLDHNPDIVSCKTFTCLYYVNTCDGDTFIFNEKEKSSEYTVKGRVTPKKGRILIFDGEHYHASSSPKENNFRMVLTFNYHEQRVL